MTVVMKTMDIELLKKNFLPYLPLFSRIEFKQGIKFMQVCTSPSVKVNHYYVHVDVSQEDAWIHILNNWSVIGCIIDFQVDYEKGWANFTVNLVLHHSLNFNINFYLF
jgi:hypothetical protein